MFAARLTDMHVCPMVTPGLPPIPHVGGPIIGPGIPNVLIQGLPVSVSGDTCMCVGPPDVVVKGALTVLVSGRPMSIVTGTTAHGGTIVVGCFTVMVNNPAGNAASAAAAAAGGAAAAAGAAADAAAAMDQVSDAFDDIADLESILEEGGNLTEAQAEQLNELKENYDDTIDDMGMDEPDFEDWTE